MRLQCSKLYLIFRAYIFVNFQTKNVYDASGIEQTPSTFVSVGPRLKLKYSPNFPNNVFRLL